MIIENQTFDEERALYGLKDLTVKNCRFDGPADDESAFKECRNIDVTGCFMNLRYPFWHVEKAKITDTNFTENCRAALWYDKDILIENSRLGGIKAIRECENISLKNCSVNSPEFAWKSQKLKIENVTIEESEYPFFEIRDAKLTGLKMKGKYSFQYDENIEISDSELNTKDAFWHTKNVTVKLSCKKRIPWLVFRKSHSYKLSHYWNSAFLLLQKSRAQKLYNGRLRSCFRTQHR